MAQSNILTKGLSNRAYHSHSVVDLDGVSDLLPTQTVGITIQTLDSARVEVDAAVEVTYSPAADEDIYLAGVAWAVLINAALTDCNVWATRMSRTMVRINVLPVGGTGDVSYATLTLPTLVTA
jgi:hypothetical protein